MSKKRQTCAVHVTSACTSLVCMAQMGTMTTVAAVSMGTMAATSSSVPIITTIVQAIGLGFLIAFPAILYQILLMVILGFTIFVSYYSYRFNKNLGRFSLTVISSLLLYTSIYVFISEPLYWIAFLFMLISAVWSHRINRKQVSKVL